MTEQSESQTNPIRLPGQELGNPNPPSLMEVPHEGHKADSEAWTRTKNKRYLKKRAQQLINKGSDDKALKALVSSRRA